jgi:hypothetical protein
MTMLFLKVGSKTTFGQTQTQWEIFVTYLGFIRIEIKIRSLSSRKTSQEICFTFKGRQVRKFPSLSKGDKSEKFPINYLKDF